MTLLQKGEFYRRERRVRRGSQKKLCVSRVLCGESLVFANESGIDEKSYTGLGLRAQAPELFSSNCNAC